jgi:hypothetical protein
MHSAPNLHGITAKTAKTMVTFTVTVMRTSNIAKCIRGTGTLTDQVFLQSYKEKSMLNFLN